MSKLLWLINDPVREALTNRIPSLDPMSLVRELIMGAHMYYLWTEAVLARIQVTHHELDVLIEVAGYSHITPDNAVEFEKMVADNFHNTDFWTVDYPTLSDKLHRLSNIEISALALALHNGHKAVREHGHEDIHAVLASLGLVPYTDTFQARKPVQIHELVQIHEPVQIDEAEL